MKTIGATRPPRAGEDPQAVIRQARRRHRRRQLVTGVVAVLVLGGALGGYAAATGTGHRAAARAASGSGHRSPPGPAGLGIGATVLLWPVGHPGFGPGWGPPAYLGNLDTGRLALRQVPGITAGDFSRYMVAVGRQLVYSGQDGTTAIAADLTGTPRVLGPTEFFAPSAEPGQVWLIYQRETARVVRSAPVTGGRPGPAVTLPANTWLVQGTERGLLLEGPPDGTLQLWIPGHALRPLPYSPDWSDSFAADARLVAYGTGCNYHEGINACSELRVFDVVTGRLDSFRAPQGTAGWVRSGTYPIGMDNAISPRDTMIAAEAVTSARHGQARLLVLPLGSRHQKPAAVPSSAVLPTAMTTWSADGSWLFYQGPDGHLWAYQAATGRTRASDIPCCQYFAMAAIPSPP